MLGFGEIQLRHSLLFEKSNLEGILFLRKANQTKSINAFWEVKEDNAVTFTHNCPYFYPKKKAI